MQGNAEWRARLQAEFTELASTLRGMPAMEATLTNIAGLVENVSGQLLGSVDLLTGLVLDYSPVLSTDSERIRAESCDSEMMTAFTAVLGLAFPFGPLIRNIAQFASPGPTKAPTSPSSPSQPGAKKSRTSTR